VCRTIRSTASNIIFGESRKVVTDKARSYSEYAHDFSQGKVEVFPRQKYVIFLLHDLTLYLAGGFVCLVQLLFHHC
jgi:hypothetical protein